MAVALAIACAPVGEAFAQFNKPSGTQPHRSSDQGCEFEVLAGFYFGNYDDGSASSVFTTATFQIQCKGIGNSPVIFESGPSSVSGDFQNRRMRGPGGSELAYQLFTNASRTIVWGDGSRDTSPITIQQSGSNKQVTVYAELFGSQSGEVGAYGDTIVVTIQP